MADRIMQRLTNGGKTGVFLGAIVVVLIALFLPGWYGAILLLAIIGALAWIMSRTWPVAAPQTRTFRLLVLLALMVVAAIKILR